jgi:hypothetical protein
MAFYDVFPFSAMAVLILLAPICRADYDSEIDKDCLGFDTDNAYVAFVAGDWKIVDGDHWMFSFGEEEQYARRALQVIREYRFNASCFAGRPNPPVVYLLASGKAPEVPISGEQCSQFDLMQLSVSRVGDAWIILSGSDTLFHFGQKENEARRALRVLQHHGFRQRCIVGTSGSSFRYLRR